MPEARPYVTYLLLGINWLIFLVMYHLSGGQVELVGKLFGDKDNALIHAGQIWRLITAIFLHGGVVHIAVNSMSLYMFGPQMERLYGPRKYFIIYLIAGITGYIMSFAFSPASSVGASGAIFGLVGAGIVFPLRYRDRIPARARNQILSQLIMVAAINLIGGGMAKGIDNSAHIGGLLGGGLVALFLEPDALARGPRRSVAEMALTAVTVALIALTVCSGLAQWQWAEHQLNPHMRVVTSGGADPWWSIRIPLSWRSTENPSRWQTPNGGMVTLADSTTDIATVNDAVTLMQKAGSGASRITIDGKPGKWFLAGSGSDVVLVYVIGPYPDHIVVLWMQCPASAFGNMELSFQQVASSIRFIHPPDTAPATQ
jgi:rhomboid protease GluP